MIAEGDCRSSYKSSLFLGRKREIYVKSSRPPSFYARKSIINIARRDKDDTRHLEFP